MMPASVTLDPHTFSPDVDEIVTKLKARTVGQDHAAEALGHVLETFLAGYHDPERPVSVILDLGPTGTGKTRSLRPCARKNLPARAQDGPDSHFLPLRCFWDGCFRPAGALNVPVFPTLIQLIKLLVQLQFTLSPIAHRKPVKYMFSHLVL